MASRVSAQSKKEKEPVIYSEKYADDRFEYRHVFLPKHISDKIPKDRLFTETEWRSIGVQQSHGWEHYMIHSPEPHILLFRRELDYLAKYGDRPRPAGASTLNTNMNVINTSATTTMRTTKTSTAF